MGALEHRQVRAVRLYSRRAAEIEQSLKALADAQKSLAGADDEAGRAAAQALAEARTRLLEARAALAGELTH